MVIPERVDAESAFLRLLINQLKPSVRSSPNALAKLLDQVAGMVGGHAVVFTIDGKVISRGGVPSTLLKAYRSVTAARVRSGELGAASVVLEGLYLQIVGIGSAKPRSVIVVGRRTQYPTWMASLVNCAAVALSASSALSRVERLEHQLALAIEKVRVAVVTQLIAGDVEAARRLADPAVLGILNAPLTRIFVIECLPGRQSGILESCQRLLAGVALVAADPRCNDRVVIVAPAAASTRSEEARQVMQSLAAQHQCTVGESGPVAIDHMCRAYEMAVHALRVARRQPERIALYSGERQLADLLDDTARPWAKAYLKPLHELPEDEVCDLLTVIRQVLRYGHGGAAASIGLNRKTVATRWNRAAAILGLDLGDMCARAELNFALEILQNTSGSPEPTPAMSLAEILMTPEARRWAEEFVGPLNRDSRPLLRTVKAWICANGRIEECAERLDAHPNTVRNHLAVCERLLGRRLVGRAGGANDLVTAVCIVQQGASISRPTTDQAEVAVSTTYGP